MDVEEIIDGLYALPVKEFTQARNQAERELRKAGQRDQAEQVKALRKPNAAAAAVNRLVRAHRAQVEEFLDSAAKLRDAQVADKGDLAAAGQAERKALQELVGLGGDAVRPALQAAAVDDNTARELLEARLVREPEPAGFGTLLAHAKPSGTKPSAGRQPRRRDDTAARTRLQEAKSALAAATEEERQARRRWTQTQRELEKAQAAVEKAQDALDRLHD